MKITIVCKNQEKSWTVNDFIAKAKKNKIEIDLIDINSTTINKKILNSLGDIIIWRSSSLNKYTQKPKFLKKLSKYKYIINQSYITNPNLVNKSVQQILIKSKTDVPTIETFKISSTDGLLKLITDKKLNFPFIAKHDLGSKGENVYLVKNKTEGKQLKDIKKFVFQNFITNDGDYRVFVIGGVPVGIMKRIAKKGSHLNNYSQGGSVQYITNTNIQNKLFSYAAKIAQICDLNICGVDIIRDSKTNKYYFLEVNSVPQWEGFAKTTKINISKKIIDYCKSINDRKDKLKTTLIEEYFSKNIQFLPIKKQVHFFSRLYLWTKKDLYKSKLSKLLPKDNKSIIQIINNILSRHDSLSNINLYQTRKPYLQKYPKILNYFDVLFMEVLYKENFNIDIRHIVDQIIGQKEFVKIYNKLLHDKKSIAYLSTYAINILYMIENHLSLKTGIKPKQYLKISKEYLKSRKYISLKIYLLTHVIIGQSKFYNQKVQYDIEQNIKIIQYIEQLITNSFKKISLDIKLEFIVCTKMLNYKSQIENKILQEASSSMSKIGNYIIDIYNDNHDSFKKDFISSEHRNVLYIMADTKPHWQ
jgi:RimK family alpha-L-glutamate ligase